MLARVARQSRHIQANSTLPAAEHRWRQAQKQASVLSRRPSPRPQFALRSPANATSSRDTSSSRSLWRSGRVGGLRRAQRFFSTQSPSTSETTAPTVDKELSRDEISKTKPIEVPDTGKVPIATVGEVYKTLLFTCTVCNTRSARSFSSKSYYEGVVIITCPECDKKHLIADNLGWFRPGKTNIETIAAEHGQKVAHMTSEELIDAPPEIKAKLLEAARLRREFLASKEARASVKHGDELDPVKLAVNFDPHGPGQ